MALFTGQIYPGDGLGFLALGTSLHDILTRLKAEPLRFPQLELLFSREQPVNEPVTVNLPANGLRLRFDGAQQRLRLIEVIDFTKSHITTKDRDLVRPPVAAAGGPSQAQSVTGTSGPSFKHIYNILGPTYPGEFIPPNPSEDSGNSQNGIYVLSYPGVAFTFQLPVSAYSPDRDVVSLLKAAPNQTATSMAIFSGDSWREARETLWTASLHRTKPNPALPRSKDTSPDDVSLIRIHGGGKLQLFRKWTSSSFWITLGETTPQDLVAELGPPNAIYRKSDKRMTIHALRTVAGGADGSEAGRQDDLTDTDQSSFMTGSEDNNDEEAMEEQASGMISNECFYNYFYLGFDVLISTPTQPSRTPPPVAGIDGTTPLARDFKNESPDRLVATKLVLHGNIPGSYEFNRHRRCCWDVGYLRDPSSDESEPTVNSETRFAEIEERLNERWGPLLPPGSADQRQRGMVLNRGWGDSPGSSCELLGGWEDSSGTAAADLPKGADGSDSTTTTLYGFPGLVFEVLRNGYVNTVTVF